MSETRGPAQKPNRARRARHVPKGLVWGAPSRATCFYSFRRSRLTMVCGPAVTVLFLFCSQYRRPVLAVQNSVRTRPQLSTDEFADRARCGPLTAKARSCLGTDEQGRDVFSRHSLWLGAFRSPSA